MHHCYLQVVLFFFFQAEDGIRDVAVTGVQTCALPIFPRKAQREALDRFNADTSRLLERFPGSWLEVKPASTAIQDRKSTRLNSSHGYISYAVFCLKKKKKKKKNKNSMYKKIKKDIKRK